MKQERSSEFLGQVGGWGNGNLFVARAASPGENHTLKPDLVLWSDSKVF